MVYGIPCKYGLPICLKHPHVREKYPPPNSSPIQERHASGRNRSEIGNKLGIPHRDQSNFFVRSLPVAHWNQLKSQSSRSPYFYRCRIGRQRYNSNWIVWSGCMYVILLEIGLLELGEKRKEIQNGGLFGGRKKIWKRLQVFMEGGRRLYVSYKREEAGTNNTNQLFCSSKRRRATDLWSFWNSDNTCGDNNLECFPPFDTLHSFKISKRPIERRFVIARLIMIAVTIMIIIIIILSIFLLLLVFKIIISISIIIIIIIISTVVYHLLLLFVRRSTSAINFLLFVKEQTIPLNSLSTLGNTTVAVKTRS